MSGRLRATIAACRAEGAVPELTIDPRFVTNGSRTEHVDELLAELERTFSTRATGVWLGALGAAGVPCGPINDVGQVLADPQVLARTMVVDIDDPHLGPLRLAGNPIKMSGFPDPPTRGPVPALDGHRPALLAELGLDG